MHRFPSDDLTVVLDLVSWSLPSTFEESRVHHGYRQQTVVHQGQLVVDGLGWLVDPFAPVWSARLSCIDPGGFIVRHIDAGPYRERWQVPITDAGALNGVRAEVGVPFRVFHHEWHEVRNDDLVPRVVLVVDRDVMTGAPMAPFQKEDSHADHHDR